MGRNYSQVHNLKPLGDRTKPSQTLLADLAILCANCHVMVLCANCHVMVHRRGGAVPLNSLLASTIARAVDLI